MGLATSNIVYGGSGKDTYSSPSGISAIFDSGGNDSVYIGYSQDAYVTALVDRKHIILETHPLSAAHNYTIIFNWFDGNGNQGTGCIENIRYSTQGFLATLQTSSSSSINNYISKGYFVNLKYYDTFSQIYPDSYGAYLDSAATPPVTPVTPAAPATALWFEEDYYLLEKATALNAASYQGRTDWSAANTKTLLASAGLSPLTHYQAYGWHEGLSPDRYFDQNQYLASKATQLNSITYNGRTNWTGQDVRNALGNTDPFQHYRSYGAFENGVNPSSVFNDATYYTNKGLQMGLSATSVMALFKSAGIDPVSHYLTYGISEGVSPTTLATR